jgi:hypothetical protein
MRKTLIELETDEESENDYLEEAVLSIINMQLNKYTNVKRLEERKLVEESDHKLTEELFSSEEKRNINKKEINKTEINENVKSIKQKGIPFFKKQEIKKTEIKKREIKKSNKIYDSFILDPYYDIEDKY